MLRCVTLIVVLAALASAAGTSRNDKDSSQLKSFFDRAIKTEFNLEDLPEVICTGENSDPFREIKYYLYTRIEPRKIQIKIDDRGWSLKNSSFNVLKKTKFLIHAWLQEADEYLPFIYDYLTMDNCNVILMDWSMLSRRCNLDSTHNYVVDEAGKSLGVMMKKLLGYGADSRDFHLVGYSVGVHMAGISAKMLTPKRVGRITALDPIGYHFDAEGKPKIQNGDALFVDVIYSSQSTLASDFEFGDASFYPNGGYHPQNGVGQENVIESSKRSVEYFRESITTSYAYRAYKCQSMGDFTLGKCFGNEVNYMGEDASPSVRGKFYLKTNSQKPYFLVTSPMAEKYNQ